MRRAVAVFDIDGTVLRNTSAERIFVRYLLRKGELGLADGVRFAAHVLVDALRGWRVASKGNKHYLKGKRPRRIEKLAADCFERDIAPRVSQAARERIQEHRRDGLQIVLLSGTLDVLLRLFSSYLGADQGHGARLETHGGRYTGNVRAPYPYGRTKAQIVRAHYGDGSYDLSASYAYADRASDLEVLGLFGHPCVVNATGRLAREAKRRGIPTASF